MSLSFWGNVDLGGRAVEGFGSRRATLSDVRIYQPPRAGALESTGPSSPGNRKSGGGGRGQGPGLGGEGSAPGDTVPKGKGQRPGHRPERWTLLVPGFPAHQAEPWLGAPQHLLGTVLGSGGIVVTTDTWGKGAKLGKCRDWSKGIRI